MRSAPMLAMTMALLATACSHQDTQLDAIARELEAIHTSLVALPGGFNRT